MTEEVVRSLLLVDADAQERRQLSAVAGRTGWTTVGAACAETAVGLLQGDAAPELNFQPYFWTEGFGLSLKSVGFTPVAGAPDYCEPGKDPESMLLRWENKDGSGTAAAVNYRIPIPKLRRLADVGPGALRPAAPVNV